MWSVLLQEKKGFCCISSFSLLHPLIPMRGFQSWGRTSTVTFEGSVVQVSSEPGYFCPFLVNIAADNVCDFHQQKMYFHFLPLPADSNLLVGSGFSQ